ncbi:MAG: nickel pincer cofactor biosynthesis protein LarB [Bryobacterales bacterium]|nr:nickel pincer cofactor biosynthesis protein LarB [Bryobacterales bacterium]
MNDQQLKQVLAQVREGVMTEEDALKKIRILPFEDVGYAKLDHHRAIRHGMPEAVFGEGKTPEQLVGIAGKLLAHPGNVILTRVSDEACTALSAAFPEIELLPQCRAARFFRDKTIYGKGKVVVMAAGTTDIPVAEEAAATVEVMGSVPERIYDVGVAGIHRLFGSLEAIMDARVVICCAGMEGALPSVVGGLVPCPVIAVPTGVGYGASFQGLAALLTMLNSCASNVTVVNIGNGFGAGYVASLINRI